MPIDPEVVLRHLLTAAEGNPPSPIWAVLDAARDRRIYPFIRDHVGDPASLYSGPPARDLLDVAPYLVRVRQELPYTRELIAKAWSGDWGIFLVADTNRDQLRRHLRNFLRVQDGRGRKLLFRFYDPRVLRAYLPTCSHAELQTVFGPITAFVTPAEDSGTLLEFRIGERGRLLQRAVPLLAAPATAATGVRAPVPG